MLSQINTLILKSGGRIELLDVTQTSINFRWGEWGEFELFSVDGKILEVQGDWMSRTDNSKWLEGISEGKTRDAEGRLA